MRPRRGGSAAAGTGSRAGPTTTVLPRHYLRRWLPGRRRFSEDRALRGIFGRLLGNPNLWHLNRHSVAWGLSVGLLVSYVPVPLQMVIAAGLAILIGCNLPIAVVSVWVSNPITMGPMFFAAYKIGSWILGVPPPAPFHFEMSLEWLRSEMHVAWRPFLLGCLVLGLALATVGHLVVRLIWRIHVVAIWRSRRQRRTRER